MYFHWKSLFGFAFVFWIVLCLSDILNGKPTYYLEQDYDRKDWEEFHQDNGNEFTGKLLKFGWSIFIWNTLTFFLSVIFCSFSKTLIWMVLRLCLSHRYNGLQLIESQRVSLNHRSDSSLSKIPIKVRSGFNSTRSSETDVEIKPKFSTKEVSCPNLLPTEESTSRSPQDVSPATPPPCQTIYQNNKVFPAAVDPDDRKVEQELEGRCVKLREDMSRMQSNSLREQAALSRRLEAVCAEKKDLNKKLAVLQKENRAAKQQLDELVQEKVVLVKRLEVANKELKCNTKSKKLTLQKLEEAMSTSENMRTQLEQAMRDKEILEGKLKLLEGEYEKLKDKVLTNNQKNFQMLHVHTPERDTNGIMENRSDSARCEEPLENHTEGTVSPISQTELDMKKIQTKIQQLEKNLENLNVTKTEVTYARTGEAVGSDGSISVRDNGTDNQMRSSDETDFSDTTTTPRLRFWPAKPTDMIQALGYGMSDGKVHYLDNIRESRSERVNLESELDEYSSGESLDWDTRPPQRIVSSSRAFQNFLRCLPVGDHRKRSISSHSDLNF